MNKRFIPIILVVVLVLAGLALWFGLRGETPLGQSGNVFVYAPEGTQIIVIDGSGAGNTEDSTDAEFFEVPGSGRLALDLGVGDYEILANRSDVYNPWVKQISIMNRDTTELYPFFFPKTAELEQTTESNIVSAFSTPPTLPTSENPRANESGDMELYVSSQTVFVEWVGTIEDMPEFFCPGVNTEECQLQPIYTSGTTIENVALYGDRDELLIADLGSVIVALELDRRGTQNIHPVRMGTSPVAFRIIDGDIYISEAGVVSKVLLD